ncbi:DUF11 domain-containing protein [Psychrobacter sp. Cmf 22.2]|uniref:DUF11 domain-containing protein n=1 Tax=Psychrobacter sp. Cmf 22.2 TaxID=1926478 RepID=UPI0009469143|nr:DUF11 domain-containing protein [Psychrobacter sp. Cmf 22.2]OLF39506.1 hypothetical protein BTV98_03685 [Psychrobacter sp. Cmf 22.2]
MRTNIYKHSVLTAGIVATMSMTAANAAEVVYDEKDAFSVANKATATYTVADNSNQQIAESNEVVVNVTETGAFSLVAKNDDTSSGGAIGDDLNENIAIHPAAGSSVNFNHTLSNDGNISDTYTIALANPSNSLPASATIKYQIKEGNANVGNSETIAIGGTITLKPGQTADITITATTSSDRVIGNDTSFTVTATSKYLTDKGQTTADKKATNTNNAITTTPVYAITKSATTNLNNKIFDTNNANAYVDYTITVKNEGNIDGTAVKITDALPAGLVAIKTGEDNYTAPTVVASGTSTAKDANISTNGKEITVIGQDIKMNETITVTFRAKKDTTTPATGTNITNYALVEDDVDGNGSFDLVDSSGDAADTSVSEKTYEDTSTGNYKGKDSNSNATITTSNQTRNLAIKSNTLDQEVALISQNNTYIYTITNKGTDIVEAASADKVYFTVAPTTNDANITINEAEVFVDANDNGSYDSGETLLTKTANGYDLNEAATTGLAPDDFVKIGVTVNTNGSGSNLVGGTNNIDDSETMTVTVLPQGPVAGTPAPANASVSSTTTMKGVNLLKYQAVAACKAGLTTLSWTTDSISGGEAKPGNCVYYKITAENTFSDASKVINGLTVTDTLETPKIIYEGDFTSETSGGSPAAKATYSNPDLVATFDSLAASEIGTIYFSAQISQTGTN